MNLTKNAKCQHLPFQNNCRIPELLKVYMKFKYEKTDYGWKAYFLKNNAYIYFGHYQTKKSAKEAADYFSHNGYPDESSPLREKYMNDYPYIQF